MTGLAILFWSGLEDSDAGAVTLLGALSSLSFTLWLLSRVATGHALKLLYFGLSGALVGALAALCTATLMLFKNLRHAHVFPDYPAAMLLAALERLPLWAIAGALAGLGLGLLLASRLNDRDSNQLHDCIWNACRYSAISRIIVKLKGLSDSVLSMRFCYLHPPAPSPNALEEGELILCGFGVILLPYTMIERR